MIALYLLSENASLGPSTLILAFSGYYCEVLGIPYPLNFGYISAVLCDWFY